jgi:hypothetical protein
MKKIHLQLSRLIFIDRAILSTSAAVILGPNVLQQLAHSRQSISANTPHEVPGQGIQPPGVHPCQLLFKSFVFNKLALALVENASRSMAMK